jgi:proteasome lid subunit RPN8/RPN11
MRHCIIEILSGAGRHLGRAAVAADFAPAFEWTRLEGARSGRLAFSQYDIPGSVLPLWHEELSRPYLQGFRTRLGSGGSGGFSLDFSLAYFRDLAAQASALLVEDGRLRAGDRFLYLVSAYPVESGASCGSGGRFEVAEAPPEIPVLDGRLAEFLRCAAIQGPAQAETVPVFIVRHVLEDVVRLTRQAEQVETGGFLIGHLRRDGTGPDVFMEVTAQVPAACAVGEQTRLRFTPDSWTAARSAIALRRRREMLLGWWHSHPVKQWNCRDCPPDRRNACEVCRGFLSEHDRALHRAVFFRAWCVAMVLSDVDQNDPVASLFGWNRGLIERRGFYVLDVPP